MLQDLQIIKSKKRVADHGEVYTSESEVLAMLQDDSSEEKADFAELAGEFSTESNVNLKTKLLGFFGCKIKILLYIFNSSKHLI